MSIYLSEIIFAIIRGQNGKLFLKTFPLTLEREPSDAELRQHFNYSVSLSSQYSSDLPFLKPQESFFLNSTRYDRRKAFSFQETSEKIQSEYDVVAISHRRGGWKTFTWNYNNDISFEIFSNFGYGSCSELISRYFYKGIQLTPYSDYIHYRYANYSQLVRYTHSYNLEYSEWRNLMNDTLIFYNAICDNKEHEVFRWLKSHLNQMVSGLEKLFVSSDYVFDRPNKTKERVAGNELEIVKAEKIGGAVEFIENIEILPVQINPKEYVQKLRSIFLNYLPYANSKVVELKAQIPAIEQQIMNISIMPAIAIYDRLHRWHYYKDSWFLESNRRKMLRFLIALHQRLGSPFSKEKIKIELKHIEAKLKGREDLKNKLIGKEDSLEAIKTALAQINSLKAE